MIVPAGLAVVLGALACLRGYVAAGVALFLTALWLAVAAALAEMFGLA